MALVHHDPFALLSLSRLAHAFNLVNDDSVFVDGGAEDEVVGLLLDQKVSVRSILDESCRGSNSEDGFPCVGPRERGVEFVREFHALLVLVELWVEEEVSIGLLC